MQLIYDTTWGYCWDSALATDLLYLGMGKFSAALHLDCSSPPGCFACDILLLTCAIGCFACPGPDASRAYQAGSSIFHNNNSCLLILLVHMQSCCSRAFCSAVYLRHLMQAASALPTQLGVQSACLLLLVQEIFLCGRWLSTSGVFQKISRASVQCPRTEVPEGFPSFFWFPTPNAK
jgi:hypothetical protein